MQTTFWILKQRKQENISFKNIFDNFRLLGRKSFFGAFRVVCGICLITPPTWRRGVLFSPIYNVFLLSNCMFNHSNVRHNECHVAFIPNREVNESVYGSVVWPRSATFICFSTNSSSFSVMLCAYPIIEYYKANYFGFSRLF